MSRPPSFFPGRRVQAKRAASAVVASASLNTTDEGPENAAVNITRAVIEFRGIFGDSKDVHIDFNGFRDEDVASAEELCHRRREIINARRTKYLEEDYFFDMFQSDATSTVEISAVSRRKSLQQSRSESNSPAPPKTSLKEAQKSKSVEAEAPKTKLVKRNATVQTPTEKRQMSRTSLTRSGTLPKEVSPRQVDKDPIPHKRPKLDTSKGRGRRKATPEVTEVESKLKCEEIEIEDADEDASMEESDSVEEEEVEEEEEEEEDEEDDEDELNTSSSARQGSKQIIRPSKLGGFSTPSFGGSASFSTPSSTKTPASTLGFGSFSLNVQTPVFPSAASSSSSRLFGASPSDLIVEGKRQWKPSAKVQESSRSKDVSFSMFGSQIIKKPVLQINEPSSSKSIPVVESVAESIPDKSKQHWDSRLRKVENKFVRSGRLSLGTPEPPVASDEEKPKSPLIRKPKFELNRSLLQQLRKPSQQVQFYEAIQGSMQSADRTPPRLLNSAKSINPAGAALVEEIAGDKLEESPLPTTSQSPGKTNNRMPGNIVCGICGAVRYYAFILQAKKFGTFSCEPCRKFISRTILKVKATGGNEGFPCITGLGKCIVPPVLRTSAMAHQKGRNSSDRSLAAEVRCQACWLKLCLIGYNLKDELYDQLRAVLPAVIKSQLPLAAKRSQSQSLLPHRGEIFECNKQVPLSRPLFDGFGGKESDMAVGVSNSSSVTANKKIGQNHVIHERLPNGWTKKAVKRLSGDQKGRWDMYLITPDQKILKSPNDLKLYIAKSGAVIDSNIVNFSLPKKTAKVDKALQKVPSLKTKSNDVNPSIMVMEESNKVKTGNKKKAPNVSAGSQSLSEAISESNSASTLGSVRLEAGVMLPKSSRRETKIPLKYREDLGDLSVSRRSYQMTSPLLVDETKIEPASEDSDVDCEEEDNTEEVANGRTEEDEPEDDINTKPLYQSRRSLGKIGVGTFSIGKDAVRALPVGAPISDLKFRTCKRTVSCKKCENCQRIDCMKCVYCLDRKKHGGKGNLKKVCVERRCMSPQMPGLPALSTFKKSNTLVKRTYVRLATAVATKSQPRDREEDNEDPSNSSTPTPTPPSPASPADESASSLDDSRAVTPSQTEASFNAAPAFSPVVAPAKPRTFPSTSEPAFLREADPNARPNMSYAALITLALDNLPNEEGTLSMIYDYIMGRFAYFRKVDKGGWQNSIRHNLSLHKEFVRSNKKEKKGCYWHLAPGANKEDLLRRRTHKEDKDTGPSPRLPPPIRLLPPTSATSNTPRLPTGAPVRVAATPTSRIDRRQSIEDFLLQGLGHDVEAPSPQKISASVTVLSALDHHVEQDSTSAQLKNKEAAPSRAAVSEKRDASSTNYWEQFNTTPSSTAGSSSQAVEAVPAQAVCCICGSAGVDEMLFCSVCAEPSHPFCLDPTELPQSSDDEKTWVCHRCAACEICGESTDAADDAEAQLRCSACCKMFHVECLEPEQRREDDVPWMCFGCIGSPDSNDASQQLCCATCGGSVDSKCNGYIENSLPQNGQFACKCDKSFARPTKTSEKTGAVVNGHVLPEPDCSNGLEPLHEEFVEAVDSASAVLLEAETDHNQSVASDAGSSEYVDVPTDIDMTGLDVSPEEIYKQLQTIEEHKFVMH